MKKCPQNSVGQIARLPCLPSCDTQRGHGSLSSRFASRTDANLLSLVICRAVNLSLERGNSDGSCFAYVWLGVIAGPHFDDYKAGFRFGRLGYELVEKRGLRRFQARTYVSFGNLVMPWTKHVKTRLGAICCVGSVACELDVHPLWL